MYTVEYEPVWRFTKNGEIEMLFDEIELKYNAKQPKQEAQANLRKALKQFVSDTPGLIANKYVEAAQRRFNNSPQKIRFELETMIREGLIVQKTEKIRDAVFDNLYLPSYRLHGKLVTIRQMERSKANIHGLKFKSIRQRLLPPYNLTPEEALAIPPTRNLKQAIDELRSKDDRLVF